MMNKLIGRLCMAFGSVLLVMVCVYMLKANELYRGRAEPVTPMAPTTEVVIKTIEVEVPVYQEEPMYIATMTATAYCTCPTCCGIWSDEHPDRIGTDYQQLTASGTVPAANRTVAVDADVIPFGTQIFFDGVWYTAEDTGSAIKGDRIDIYFDSHEEAVAFGVQEITVGIVLKEDKEDGDV